MRDGRMIGCDAPGCYAEPVDRAAFKENGGVIINHTSFFLVRDVKYACDPGCAEKVIAELARDVIAYGVRQPPSRAVH